MKAFRMYCLGIISLIVVFLLIGCETTGPLMETANKSLKSQIKKEIDGILTGAIPAIRGPKRVVAVGKFDAIGSFTSKYGDWDIGGGLATMLTSALFESGRFIVAEEANLNQILSVQELKAKGLTNPETGPTLGKLASVQFLIYGTVTEFGADNKGGGFNLGFSGMPFSNLGLGRQSAKGKVAMDIRIVDTTTGLIIENYRVIKKIKSSSWNVSGGYKGYSLGTNKFNKTPLGIAARKAITEAVQLIANAANKTKWSGRVVDIGVDNVVYINAGYSAGTNVDDKFIIQRVTKVLTDPATGEILSKQKKVIGALKVTAVEEKLSYGTYIPEGLESTKRGDLVVMAK